MASNAESNNSIEPCQGGWLDSGHATSFMARTTNANVLLDVTVNACSLHVTMNASLLAPPTLARPGTRRQQVKAHTTASQQ